MRSRSLGCQCLDIWDSSILGLCQTRSRGLLRLRAKLGLVRGCVLRSLYRVQYSVSSSLYVLDNLAVILPPLYGLDGPIVMLY